MDARFACNLHLGRHTTRQLHTQPDPVANYLGNHDWWHRLLSPQSRLTLAERPLPLPLPRLILHGARHFVVHEDDTMKIHIGFDMTFQCAQPTPMIFMVNVHPSRAGDLLTPDRLRVTPTRSLTNYTDGFGNRCTRLLAPAGELRVTTDAIVADTGLPDRVDLAAQEHAIADLPHDTLVYLLASRYCETDRLMEKAWELFGKTPRGWGRVQAICDFVHAHMQFGYQHAGAKKGAADALTEGRGVCRDFAHLAVTFCRCMNIPARYCTGYLGDIGVPPEPEPMDFSAWFEVFLAGRWHTF